MGRHQKYLRIFLSFVLAVSPIIFINNANAAVGGWTMSNPIASGASTIYNGAKTVVINGANVVKNGTAKITPTAANVSKVLARGGAGYALSVAVEQLLGAVDWVLDPANNQIKYRPKPEGTTCSSGFQDMSNGVIFCSAQALVDSHKEKNNWYSTYVENIVYRGQYADIYHCFKPNSSYQECISSMITVQVITDTDNTEVKTLPLDVVAQKVISNADSGDTNAQVATMAAAADIVKEAETDQAKAAPIVQQLENSAVTETDETATGTQTKNPTNPDVTDLSLEFPAFCGWAPTVCEAAQTVISFPTTLTNWWDTATSSISEAWTFAKDWATSEPETDTNLDIDTSEESEPNTDISFSTSCPAKIPLQFNWNGQSLDFSFDFTIWCQAISTYVYPIVVTLGSLHALYIVTGVRQDG